MRYAPAIATRSPQDVIAQPGQWIDYEGSRGRYMGRRNGCVWIAWGTTATKRFQKFAEIFHAN